MSGTKRTYNLSEKNYFKFFGIDARQGLSVRSLTTHYKKILTILKEDETFLGRDKQAFAERAFETLVDPIRRAKYLIEQQGLDTDIVDNISPEDAAMRTHYEYALNNITDEDEIEDFIADLKDQTSFVIDEIERSIDIYANYKMAMGLICKFEELSVIHQIAKDKKEKMVDGIKYVVFDR